MCLWFAKLKLFYREVMPKRGWNTYDTISVKWNHQVVATRRTKAVVKPLDYDPEDDEQAPDIETINVNTTDAGKNNKPDQADAPEPAEKANNSQTDKPEGKKKN